MQLFTRRSRERKVDLVNRSLDRSFLKDFLQIFENKKLVSHHLRLATNPCNLFANANQGWSEGAKEQGRQGDRGGRRAKGKLEDVET